MPSEKIIFFVRCKNLVEVRKSWLAVVVKVISFSSQGGIKAQKRKSEQKGGEIGITDLCNCIDNYIF